MGDASCDALYQGDVNGCKQSDHSVCVPIIFGGGRCSKNPDFDCDGVADACDNCPSVANPAHGKDGQPNCNLDQEIVSGVAYPYIGDACDPTPCASIDVTGAGSGWLKIGYSPMLLTPDQGGFSTSGGTPMAMVGTLKCECGAMAGLNKDSPVPSAQFCAKHGCPIDSHSYTTVATAGDNWTPIQESLAVSNISPPTTAPFVSELVLPVVDPVPGHVSSFAPDTTDTAYADWSYPVLDGPPTELWTHVPSVSHLSVPSSDFDQASNHYDVGQWSATLTSPFVPGGFPSGAARYLTCNICPLLLDNPNWMVDPGERTLGIVGNEGYVDFTNMVTGDVIDRFLDTGVKWIPMSESRDWVEDYAPRFASVTVDGKHVASAISMVDGHIENVLAPIVIGNPVDPTLGMVLSGREFAVFVVGGSDGFRWFDLTQQNWHTIDFDGAMPVQVLAATYRAEDSNGPRD